MDKVQQLYNLYLQKGIITSATTLEMFRAANADQQSDLYNLGKQKNLFQTTDLSTFQTAWADGGKAAPAVEKKSPDGTTMVSGSEDSSLGFQSQQGIEIPSIENQIEKITPDFVEKNEEFVVPQMQAQFGDLGFKFEESGATGDWMTVTAPNGKQTEVSLDIDWFSPGNSNDEANALKNFIRENAKAIPHIQQLENQYANSKKILTTQEEVDTEIQQMNQESDQFRNDTGVYLNDKTSLDQQLNELNKIKSNTAEYNAKKSELMAKRAELDQRFVDLSKKQEEITRKSDMLKQSVGKYAMMREQQGTWMGATVDWLAEGFAGMSASAVSNVVDLMFSKYTGGVDEEELSKQVTDNIATGNELEDAKDNVALSNAYLLNQSKPGLIPMPAAGQSYKDWWNSLSSDQKTAIVDKSNDQVKKDVKKNLLPAVREGNEIVWGDDDTSVEWRKLKEEGFWGGAYAGLVKSLPAMIGSNNALGWAQRTAQMYGQTTDAVMSEMDKNPEFDNISEAEKLAVVAPIGIASAALESIGLRNIVANKGLMNRVILGAMGKAGATTTAKTFGDLVKNEVNSMVAKGALTLAGATLAEAETGAAQQAVEYAVKDIYNLAKEKEMFQTPDFLSAEYIKEIAKAGAQEAVGGFVLGMPSAVGAAYSKKGYLSMNDATFEAFESFANDSKLQSAFIVELKNKVATGLMTPKEAKTMLNDYRNSVGLFRELPDNLDTQGKKEAMNLLKERRDLEQQIDGKEESLVTKQKERITKINEELTQISSKPKATISSTVINGNRIQVAPIEEKDRETVISELEQEFLNSPEADQYGFNMQDGTFDSVRNNERVFAEMVSDALSIEESQRTNDQNQLVRTANAISNKTNQIATPSRDLNWVEKLKADNIYELFFNDEQDVPEELRPKIWSTNTNGQVAVRANGSDVQNAFRVETTNQLSDNQRVTFTFNSLEEVPEPFRDEAREITFEGRKKVLGLPIGEKVSQSRYIVEMTGAEAKQYNVRAPRATTKADVFRNTAKSLASIFPDLQVMNFANANEMKQYAATNLNQQVADSMDGNENGAIIYDASGKPAFIFINDESSDATTLPHEAWHGILLKAFGENPALFKEFRESIMKTLKKNGFDNIVAELDAFSSDPNYIDSNTQAEEWLVQFGGLLTASGLRVDSLTGRGKSLLLDIKEILNKIAVKITGQPIFLEDATPDDILDFMISISETMARGEDLSKFFREGEGAASGAGMRAQMPSNIRLEPIDFENESENIDVYYASEKANQIAKDNGINILRGKDLRSVAVDDNDNVVGGLWTEISGDEFSFDIAIDKESQRKGIGEELVNEAISEFNAQNFDDNLKYKIDVTNPVMEKLLSKYGFEVVDRYDGHAIMEHPTNNPKLKSETKTKSQLPSPESPERDEQKVNEDNLTALDFRKFNARFQISNKKKEEFAKVLEKKRPDLKERGLIDSVIQDVEKFGEENSQNGKGNPKLEKLAMHWIYNANVILPEDGYKIVDAEKVATKNKVDPFAYDSPEALMETFQESVKERPIDPDTIPSFTNKTEIPGTDIVVYDVADTKEGQADVRKAIDTNWGKDANPWCLAARIDGNLDRAWELWSDRYNAIDKKIAFKNGKLLCFQASDVEDKNIWWDRMDRPTKGIPNIKDLGDGKKQTVIYDDNGKVLSEGFIERKTKYKIEDWYPNGKKRSVANLNDKGEFNGISQSWNVDGFINRDENYKDGILDGVQKRYLPNGQIKRLSTYENGLENGLFQMWANNGVMLSESNYKNGELDGMYREWSEKGILTDEAEYKEGDRDGVTKTFRPSDGSLIQEAFYKNGDRDGVTKIFRRDGSLQEESEYKEGRRDGVTKIYDTDGNVIQKDIYENDELLLRTPSQVKFQRNDKGEGMFTTRDGVAIGFNYDTDKVARERFDLKLLTKLGQGSDRVVFDLGDNKVLKVAKTARGLEQNIYEGDGFLNFVPEMYERGLNYVVVDNVPKMKASDMVPTFDENGDQTGEVKASEMIKDLSKFNQRDFDRNSSELWNTVSKYGFEDIFSYDVLYGDFKAMRNWGYKDGKAYHTDGGTFGGVQMLTARPSKSLSDAEFREIYNKSKAVKKKFQDTDLYTKFQMNGSDAATIKEVQNIAKRYNINEKGFGPRQASEQSLSRELARLGYSAKRSKLTPEGYGGGIFIVDGRGKFFNPFKIKFSRINLGAGRLEEGNVNTIPGYDKMLEEANRVAERTANRGASYDRIMEAVMQYVRQSKVYQDANDSQREQLERNVRAEFGKKEKAAPSVAKILGKLADIKRITISEKELLRNHFKDLARGARDAKRAFMEASADLAKSINELASSGKISPKQVGAIINRFSKVNMFNEDSVNRFVDYMTKVFNDAEYAEKISGIRTKLAKAKNNLKSKVGIAESVVPSLRQLFAVNPLIIPDDVFDKYVAIVDMFGASGAVLPLADINQVEQDVNEILDALDQEYSQAESFAILFDNYADKVIDEDTGKVKFAETVNKMVKEGNITDDQGELMKKYKSVVFPKEPSEPKSEDEINAEKDVLISNIRSLGVDVDRLPTKDERVLADSLKRLLKPEILKQLSIADLKNLIKLIDNINNGYMPHFGELAVERLNAKTEAINLGEALLEAKPLSITEVYNNLKSKFTKKGGILEMVRSSPFFFIDQTFGNFKTKPIFNALFKQLSESQSAFTSAIGRVNKKLDKAHDAVARSFKYDANKTLESSFRMMAYMIQLEYESNPGNPQVNPASEYIKATIKKIKTGKTMYGDAEIDMLNRILDENGNVDKDALYNSFNKAEREAVKTIREVNDSLTEKAVFTAAVLRGQRIEPLNNYVHLPVMGDYNPDDTATATENSNVYNRSLNPSSKAKNLLERTRGAKPINFDVFASAQRGAKFTLLDYYMTSPIRTARKTLNETLKKYEDEFTNEQRKIFNAVEAGFEEVIGNVLTNNFIVDSFADEVVNFISKQGYRAILASSTRFVAELTSNMGFVMTKGRDAFMNGLKYFKVYTSEYGVDIMDNVLSKNTSRIYHGDTLSGRFIDQSILSQASGVKSVSSKGVVANKANQIYNLSLKKYKNVVELVADTLISTPDKMIMRPVWFGQFASEFKKQSGVEVDFDKIAANDEQYMRTYKEEIAAARDKADEMSVLVGATDNPFMGMVKGSVKPNQGVLLRTFNNFNTFMTRFAIYEYTTARQGIYAAMGNGSISRAEGMKLLAAVTVRMTVYTMLTSVLSSTLLGLLGDEDEEDDKTLAQKLGQAVASTGTNLVLGRNFGNATRSLINYGVEHINEEFLNGLRNGDYDPYKDAISFSAIPKEKKMGNTNLSDFITNMSGSFSPAMKTANLIAKKAFEPEKKEKEAIERSEKETSVRIPLEVLGNMGLIPLYKDVRKVVMQDLYKDLRNAEKNAADKKQAEKEMLHGYENKTDMKRYDPELYEKVFGKDSPGYDAEQAKKKLKHEADSLERRMKDEFYDYVPKKKEKSKKSGFGSKGFGSEKMGTKGFGTKGFGAKGFGE